MQERRKKTCGEMQVENKNLFRIYPKPISICLILFVNILSSTGIKFELEIIFMKSNSDIGSVW